MRSITIGIGTITCGHRYTGPETGITAYGNNAPEIEADAMLRVADRFAPGAVLEFNPVYTIQPLAYGSISEEEEATRLPGVEESRRFYAIVRVREVRQ